MKIAIEGCCHGSLDTIYASLQHAMETKDITIDLLICCGDFQSVRNQGDLNCLSCPPKYRAMHTFWEYYAGIKTAPIPTLFVGGNHEATNYLRELFHGGWVAPNMYFMGYSNVVDFGGVRIAGLSGIYNSAHYKLGHFESVPYSPSDQRSAYHVREYDVFKLMQIGSPVDVMISHDWPCGIAMHGDTGKLLMQKKFLRDDVNSNTLGSPPSMTLLQTMRPRYWFSAHLHVKFPAVYVHPSVTDSSPTEITRFLALDKCLPHRDFLQIVDIEPLKPNNTSSTPCLRYDPEWLYIQRRTRHLLILDRRHIDMPAGRPFVPTEEDIDAQLEAFMEANGGDMTVPHDFAITAPPHNTEKNFKERPHFQCNPQTVAYCAKLNIPIPWKTTTSENITGQEGAIVGALNSNNPDEIDIDEDFVDANQIAQTEEKAIEDTNGLFV